MILELLSRKEAPKSANVVMRTKLRRECDLSIFCLRLRALLRGDVLADSDGELGFHFELRFAKLEARAAYVAARIERQ